MRIAVTGAFGYSGRYITKRLLEAGHEVITLTNSTRRPNPFGEKVTAFPFHFEEPQKLHDTLRGVDAPPLGSTKLSEWIEQHKDTLGLHYTSEMARCIDRHSEYRSN